MPKTKSAPKSKLYVVYYRIVGQRENGSYLVNAFNKREAKKFVKECDEDYVVDQVQTIEDYSKEMGYESVEECRKDGLLIDEEALWKQVSTTHSYCHPLEEGT